MIGIVGSPLGHCICLKQDNSVKRNPFSSHKRKGWAGQSNKDCATLLRQLQTRALFLVTKDRGGIEYWIFVANSLPPHDGRKRGDQQDKTPTAKSNRFAAKFPPLELKGRGINASWPPSSACKNSNCPD